MTERPKVHAWKACVPYPGTEGSNPSLSVSPLVLITGYCAMQHRPTPPGPEGSNGKRLLHEPQSTWLELKGFFYPIRGNRLWHMK